MFTQNIAASRLGFMWCFAVIFVHVAGAQQIFKCCNSEGSQRNYLTVNISENVTISNEDLISTNITENINLLSTNGSALEAEACHPDESNLSSIFSISPNKVDIGFYPTGYIRNGDEYYSPIQYCVKKSINNVYTVKVQSSTFCDENVCIRKCCGPLEVYDLSTYGKSKIHCVPSITNPWRPNFYPSHEKDKEDLTGVNNVRFKSEHPRNWCKSGDVVLWSLRNMGTDRKSLFHIMRNGSIFMKDGASWNTMNVSRVCVDGAINIPGHFDQSEKQTIFSGDPLDTIILECGPELAEEKNSPTMLYAIALAVSTFFQFATLVVYGLLWDKQNIHGWTLLGYITTMFLFYISLLATFFYSYNYPDPDFTTEREIFSSFCGIIAVVTHFLYICTICWLTVISTDIFLTFRILKLTRTKSKNKLKFFIYLIFTLLVPSVIVGVGTTLDITYGDDVDVNLILPRYGWNKCFLDLRRAAIPYLFGPIGVLLSLNCVMYFATIFHMYQLQESTKFASANNNQIQKQRAKVRLFFKLFLLMGVSWILELISFLIFQDNANIPVIIGDMLNILQPIAIFIIFVCKKDILKSLGEKYSFVTKVFSSFEPEESITSSASSSRVPRLTKLWNPVSTTKWFRARINSTMTETSNLSNQSMKSINSIYAIDESPEPVTVSSPLNTEMETSS